MGHPATPLSPMGTGGLGGVPHMDGWVLEETKKLEAQQRIQHRKLLDLKQVCACVCACLCACVRVCRDAKARVFYTSSDCNVCTSASSDVCASIRLLCVCVHWGDRWADLSLGIPYRVNHVLNRRSSPNVYQPMGYGLCLHLYHAHGLAVP